jgi:hypothetical protein
MDLTSPFFCQVQMGSNRSFGAYNPSQRFIKADLATRVEFRKSSIDLFRVQDLMVQLVLLGASQAALKDGARLHSDHQSAGDLNERGTAFPL